MNTNKIKKYVFDICHAAHDASKLARRLSNSQRNKILSTIISQLGNQKKLIIKKNSLDIKNAEKRKMTDALIDRLLINDKRISSMVDGLKKIKSIPDTLFKKINKAISLAGYQLSK